MIGIWKIILETLFPAFCIGCKIEGAFLCDSCYKSIPLTKNGVEGLAKNSALDGLISCCPYQDKSLLQRAIHTFKYDFVRDLGDLLGMLMVESLKDQGLNDAVICPVPLHKRRLAWRGFNQSELLARKICEELGVRYSSLLKRVTFSKPQMELSREQRIVNVQNCFVYFVSSGRGKPALCALAPCARGASDFVVPATVILVDDIATTLSTLESCAKILKENGVKEVYGIVLARVYRMV